MEGEILRQMPWRRKGHPLAETIDALGNLTAVVQNGSRRSGRRR
jgi:hypothetical protein